MARIYNQGIRGRSATFETDPRTTEEMVRRIDENPDRHPVLVAPSGPDVIGWASIGPYGARGCYAGVGEFFVYIAEGHRGQGVGRNEGSRALCRAMGFREVGLYERHAQLEGRWLDVVIVEKLIPENQP